MEAFLTSTLLVALAEIGDKTQLLSFVLAARLRKPAAIVAGIFVATIANHALAGSAGVWLAKQISPQVLPWATGLLFVGFGLWALHPDALDDDPKLHRAGAFVTAGEVTRGLGLAGWALVVVRYWQLAQRLPRYPGGRTRLLFAALLASPLFPLVVWHLHKEYVREQGRAGPAA